MAVTHNLLSLPDYLEVIAWILLWSTAVRGVLHIGRVWEKCTHCSRKLRDTSGKYLCHSRSYHPHGGLLISFWAYHVWYIRSYQVTAGIQSPICSGFLFDLIARAEEIVPMNES